MSTVFQNSGTQWYPADSRDAVVKPVLPASNFVIKKNPMTGALFLEEIDSFPQPSKVYGNIGARADRIIHTFLSRSVQTGVLLSGEKGSGKSLMAKLLSAKAATLGIPTITVNAPWTGDPFFQLIQKIEQPAVILLDEFEKVYDSVEQREVLTLFDGVFPTKKLFVLTCNDINRIDSHMQNRPGRMYYAIEYKGLDETFIHEYCADQLQNHSERTVSQIVNLSRLFDADYCPFNFDMLKALVEEMNRYGETPQEALELLNINPSSSRSEFKITDLVWHDYKVDQSRLDNKSVRISPLFTQVFRVEFNVPFKAPVGDAAANGRVTHMSADEPFEVCAADSKTLTEQRRSDDGDDEVIVWEDILVTRNDLVDADVNAGVYKYRSQDGTWSMTLKRDDPPTYNFSSWNHL